MDLNQKPQALIPHITLFGHVNAGKSSLINAITQQEVSLVSEIEGTTTDPVNKRFELLNAGPVVFIDTAGLNDETVLGKMRMEKSLSVLQRTDYSLFVINAASYQDEDIKEMIRHFKRFNTPYLLIFNKIDLVDASVLDTIKTKYPQALFVSCMTNEGVEELKMLLTQKIEVKDETLVGDLIPYNGVCVCVVPIDSEAPKGRIILPQVQLIRDCLDNGIQAIVVRDTELADCLNAQPRVDLVVTDSQAFKEIDAIVQDRFPLTSFSILQSRQKGDLNTLIEGIYALENLNHDSKVLIMESCSHNVSHEDIGRVKIPRLIKNHLGHDVHIDFRMGHDFPDNVEEYDLIVHCGSCMLNKKTMNSRLLIAKEHNVPITNYGVLIAYVNGILSKTTNML